MKMIPVEDYLNSTAKVIDVHDARGGTMTDDLIQKLADCWDLVDAHFTTSESTTIEPWGPSPTGMFVMTRKGEFSAHVMRTKRSKFVSERAYT